MHSTTLSLSSLGDKLDLGEDIATAFEYDADYSFEEDELPPVSDEEVEYGDDAPDLSSLSDFLTAVEGDEETDVGNVFLTPSLVLPPSPSPSSVLYSSSTGEITLITDGVLISDVLSSSDKPGQDQDTPVTLAPLPSPPLAPSTDGQVPSEDDDASDTSEEAAAAIQAPDALQSLFPLGCTCFFCDYDSQSLSSADLPVEVEIGQPEHAPLVQPKRKGKSARRSGSQSNKKLGGKRGKSKFQVLSATDSLPLHVDEVILPLVDSDDEVENAVPSVIPTADVQPTRRPSASSKSKSHHRRKRNVVIPNPAAIPAVSPLDYARVSCSLSLDVVMSGLRSSTFAYTQTSAGGEKRRERMLNACVWVPSALSGNAKGWDESGWMEVKHKKERRMKVDVEDDYANVDVDESNDTSDELVCIDGEFILPLPVYNHSHISYRYLYRDIAPWVVVVR
jgi:hypothetical protein